MFNMVYLSIIVIALFINSIHAQTNCSEQLHNFFVDQGLNPLYPILETLNFTSGTLFGVPFVTVSLNFQEVARAYQYDIDGNSTVNSSQMYVNYVSLDLPWCTSDIAITCDDASTTNVVKTTNCDLSDFDAGGISPVAGRAWLYPDQALPCDGIMTVTFYNTTLQPSNNNAQYTYDVYGIIYKTLLTRPQALNLYRGSNCSYTNGSYAEAINQPQMRCVAPTIGCNGTRPPSLATLQVIPIPQFACRIPATSNTSEQMLWWVVSYEPIGALGGYFGASFYQNPGPNLVFLQFQGPQYSNQILTASTRRQYLVSGQDFDSQAYIFYAGRITSYDPEYARSSNPIIEDIPCICDFSADCYPNGTIDTTSAISAVINRNNKIPIADPGSTVEIPMGNFNFTLNATASYDPDNSPKSLTYYWKYFGSTPPLLLPFNLSSFNQTDAIINVPSQGHPPGIYIFILYVSDGQAISWNFFNVTILPNQVNAVVELDKIAAIGQCVPLNGSLSYSSDPNISITYNWTQFIGYPLQLSFGSCNSSEAQYGDATSAVAYASAVLIGMYSFNLTVTDGSSYSSAMLYVFFVPNFTTPVAPPFSLPNYTDPPLITKPPLNNDTLNFPNVTIPSPPTVPFGPAPVSPVPVPPVFPIFPPPTITERWLMIILGFVSLFVFCLFIVLIIALLPQDDINMYDITRYKHY